MAMTSTAPPRARSSRFEIHFGTLPLTHRLAARTDGGRAAVEEDRIASMSRAKQLVFRQRNGPRASDDTIVGWRPSPPGRAATRRTRGGLRPPTVTVLVLWIAHVSVAHAIAESLDRGGRLRPCAEFAVRHSAGAVIPAAAARARRGARTGRPAVPASGLPSGSRSELGMVSLRPSKAGVMPTVEQLDRERNGDSRRAQRLPGARRSSASRPYWLTSFAFSAANSSSVSTPCW